MRFLALKNILISAHQPRVARDIGCEDGSKSAFDPRLGHLVHFDSAWQMGQVYGSELGPVHRVRNVSF